MEEIKGRVEQNGHLVLDLDNIALTSLNRKYGVSRSGRRLFLSNEYRYFKDLVKKSARPSRVDPPYAVAIHVECFHDIDNAIKPVLDSLQSCGAISNDKEIRYLEVLKTPRKRGELARLRVFVSNVEEL